MVGTVLTAAWLLWWPRPRTPELPAQPWNARVTVLAGDGVPGGRDGVADAARFSDPFGLAAGVDGRVYVTDAGETPRVRAIHADGRVTTVAGGRVGFADGVGTRAQFDAPSGLAIDGRGVLYVADTGNNAIRRVTPDGRVSTVAGDGTPGRRDGPAALARFNGPVGVAVDATGRIIVADTYNDSVRVISPEGEVRTLAGAGTPGAQDGPAAIAQFDTPSGLAVDRTGTVYVADTGNGLVRVVRPTGEVTTLHTPGLDLVHPLAIAVEGDGTVYVSDERGRVFEWSSTQVPRLLAGGPSGYEDGIGAAARFRRPAGLASLGRRWLAVADTGNALVRVLADATAPHTRPPTSPRVAPGMDPAAFGRVPLLWPVPPLDGPHEVAGTLGEARGQEGSERLHGGIDVRMPEDTVVYAVRPGMVSSPLSNGAFDTLNEWLRIGEVTYVHIRAGRDRRGTLFDPRQFAPTFDPTGRLSRLRVKRGARFDTGSRVGSVNRFNHVHLSIGWPGEEYNPLDFRLLQFADTLPPTIAAGGIRFTDVDGRPLTTQSRGRVLLSGVVQIIVEAWDRAEGNRPGRRLGLYAAGYQILRPDGSPAPGFTRPRMTMRFDRMAGSEAARVVFAPGSGIPAYGRRETRFLYIVTNRFEGGVARRDSWDTRQLPPGDYIVRVVAQDIAGNVARDGRDVPVTVVVP